MILLACWPALIFVVLIKVALAFDVAFEIVPKRKVLRAISG